VTFPASEDAGGGSRPGEAHCLAVADPGALWLGWEAQPPRISDETRRVEGETRCADLLALPPRQRGKAVQQLRFRSSPLVEVLLEKGAALAAGDPRRALNLAALGGDLAAQLLRPGEDGTSAVAVYLGRAQYVTANAWRLLGNPAESEIALIHAGRFLGRQRGYDRAFYCRAVALLRWEQGQLDEAAALLDRAGDLFGTRQEEQAGTTLALRGLLASEEGETGCLLHSLRTALVIMDLERRPWLSVRTALALALALGHRRPDEALAVLQEVWRLSPRITDPREKNLARWWEGRVQARLGNDHDAAALLNGARLNFLKERRVPEAALASLDTMLFLAERGETSQAGDVGRELETWLGRDDGADVALQAVRDLQLGLGVGQPRDVRAYAINGAAFIRRALRFRGFRIDPLPFA
jgi:tetratricopeptide (TPR) repeat protein